MQTRCRHQIQKRAPSLASTLQDVCPAVAVVSNEGRRIANKAQPWPTVLLHDKYVCLPPEDIVNMTRVKHRMKLPHAPAALPKNPRNRNSPGLRLCKSLLSEITEDCGFTSMRGVGLITRAGDRDHVLAEMALGPAGSVGDSMRRPHSYSQYGSGLPLEDRDAVDCTHWHQHRIDGLPFEERDLACADMAKEPVGAVGYAVRG